LFNVLTIVVPAAIGIVIAFYLQKPSHTTHTAPKIVPKPFSAAKQPPSSPKIAEPIQTPAPMPVPHPKPSTEPAAMEEKVPQQAPRKEALESTNTVEAAEPEQKVTKPEPISRPPKKTDDDLASRGARLMQARKMHDIATRLIRQGQYQKAVFILQDAVQTFPVGTKDFTYGETLYHLGYSLRRSGQPNAAIRILKQALNFPLSRSKAAKELQSASVQAKPRR
jgi:TolA-binding protein